MRAEGVIALVLTAELPSSHLSLLPNFAKLLSARRINSQVLFSSSLIPNRLSGAEKHFIFMYTLYI